jgi:hypothetical protein
MIGLNRNIITQADLGDLRNGQTPRTLRAIPPAAMWTALQPAEQGRGAPPPAPRAGGAAAGAQVPGGVPVPTEDDYLTKLLKYVPLDVVGAYLFLAGVVESNVTIRHDRAVWFGSLLLAFLVITVVYDLRVMRIVRAVQIGISVIGLAVYVFSIRGWFSMTTWYHAWYTAIALPAFALLVATIQLGPLRQQQ